MDFLLDVFDLLFDTFCSLPELIIKFIKRIRAIFLLVKTEEANSTLYETTSTSTGYINKYLQVNHSILQINVKEIKKLPQNVIDFINIIHEENSMSFMDNAKEIRLKVKKEFICPISQQVMNIPVCIGDYSYDLQSLLNLPELPTGEREIPIIKKTFYLDEIKPHWDLKIKIQWAIKDAENHYLNKDIVNSERIAAKPKK